VRVNGADDDGVGLPGKLQVGVESPLASQEAAVLESPDRLSDPERPHQARLTPREPASGWAILSSWLTHGAPRSLALRLPVAGTVVYDRAG
jgi:hypothetical protein